MNHSPITIHHSPFNWSPPDHWQKFTALDAHTGGEPLRIILEGWPDLPGDTILAKRRVAQEKYDSLRQALMWEPRGHADMYGAIITRPVTPDGDFGVLFLHNEGFSTMCGHGIIALTQVGLNIGLFDKPGEAPTLKIDTPAGRVVATGHRENGRVKKVSFLNVPSFVYALDQVVEVPGLGALRYDVAFGGAFYAFVNADELNLSLRPNGFGQQIDWGRRITTAVTNALPIIHPFEPDMSFLYGTIFIGQPQDPQNFSRNVCVFGDGEVDRSPTGTGVSARAALHLAKGELKMNEPFIVESILESCFTGEAVESTRFGEYQAVIPKVTGSAYLSGINTLVIDPDDPLGYGFFLR